MSVVICNTVQSIRIFNNSPQQSLGHVQKLELDEVMCSSFVY